MSETNPYSRMIHDARAPLNRISMQAELIKIILESQGSVENAQEAADKIISACQECSEDLQRLSDALKHDER